MTISIKPTASGSTIEQDGSTILTIDGSGNLTIPKNLDVTGAYNATAVGNKNLIINGDMRIAQRGTSASVSGTTFAYRTVDRVLFRANGVGAFTESQDTDVPSGQGFSKSVKYLCTTSASPSTSGWLQFNYRMEGQNLQHLNYGTSEAKKLTASFWVKSNKTGTYITRLYSPDTSRSIQKAITINSADTWEKKIITFDGDTVGSLDNDNNYSLSFDMWLSAGTDFQSGTLATTWSSYSNPDTAVGQVNLADSTSNYINITGVQLEVGDTATPFEHRPYDTELQRCYRYYQVLDGTGANYAFYSSGAYINGTNCRGVLPIDNIFRAFPTATFTGAFRVISDADRAVTAIILMSTAGTRPTLGFSATTSAGSGGNAGYLSANADGNTSIEFDAEL